MSDFGDLFQDPQHPQRPQHPDFWRIVEVVNEADGQTSEGEADVPDVLLGLVDVESVTYAAKQRALRVQKAVFAGPPDGRLTAVLGGVWIDAFTAGVRFQQQGGHRPS